jgi:hypothetical protein
MLLLTCATRIQPATLDQAHYRASFDKGKCPALYRA